MKSIIAKSIAVTAMGLLFSINSQAQVIVKVRPQAPTVVVERPAARPGYYWRDPEWRVNHGAYVYVGPKWIKERHNHVWVPGHWAPTRGGEVWVPGHWQ